MIRMVFNDEKQLKKIHNFLKEEIYQEPEWIEIPEKYKALTNKIAEHLIAGFICFYNPKTKELEEVLKSIIDDPEEFESMTGESIDSLNLKHQLWEDYITFEAMDSNEAYQVMESFVEEVHNTSFQNQLYKALDNRKPFGNFKHLVENSNYRQEWYDFQQKQYTYYVWRLLETNLA